MNKEIDALVAKLQEWMNSRDFYELSQAYRTAPVADQAEVISRWNNLKVSIAGNARSALMEARALGLEEAAKVCCELAELNRTVATDSMWQWYECAAAIRALKGD